MNINLDWYPHLKEEICDIFNVKVSLADLARELEKDLVLIETAQDKFKLCLKKEIIEGYESRIKLNTEDTNMEYKSEQDNMDQNAEDFFTPTNKSGAKHALALRDRTKSEAMPELAVPHSEFPSLEKNLPMVVVLNVMTDCSESEDSTDEMADISKYNFHYQ